MSNGLQDILDAAGQAKVIVVLKKDALAKAAGSDLGRLFAAQPREVAESLAAASDRLRGRELRARSTTAKTPPMRVYPNLGLALGTITRENFQALRSDKRVRDVVAAPELSLIRPVARAAARVSPEPTWGIQRLRAPEAWAAGYTGEGVIVGHLDTGIDGEHPALDGAIHSYAEFDLAGNIVPGSIPRDSGEHGTHTAGTIAGRHSRGRAIGTAPGCKLASAMVIEGGDVVARILGGMDWVIGEGAAILSMSLGLRGYTTAFQVVIDELRAANVLPVVAVGNEFANSSRSPGNYANVVSVGAIDRQDKVADFSSSECFNRPIDPIVPDLVAPGVEVLSCIPSRRYVTMDGTSMATPHVAGLAALLKQAVPLATANDLEEAIFKSCQRPANMLEMRGNRGIPDAVSALGHLGISLPQAVAAVARSSKPAKKKKPAKRRSV